MGSETLLILHLRMGDYSDEDQPESEEDVPESNPYPLEGKYIDEDDRQR